MKTIIKKKKTQKQHLKAKFAMKLNKYNFFGVERVCILSEFRNNFVSFPTPSK